MENEANNYIQDEYLNIYEDNFLNDDSYYFNEDTDEKYFYNLPSKYRMSFMDRDLFVFKKLIRNRKIKILKKPSLLGWFVGGVDKEEDIKYTYEKYREKLKYYREDREYRRRQDAYGLEILEQRQRDQRLEREKNIAEMKESYLKGDLDGKKFNLRKSFKNNFPKIIEIYKNFVMENDQQLNDLLDYLLKEKKYTENETFDFLIEEARRKYNFEKEGYNKNVRNFSQLSLGMKEKPGKWGKIWINFF